MKRNKKSFACFFGRFLVCCLVVIVPATISGSEVGSISTGMFHTCALTSSGAVKCWGDNEKGELGNGTNTDSNVPVNTSGLGSGIKTISAGLSHTCALTSSGAVKCWGNNEKGGLGNGTNTSSNVPVNVSGLGSGISAISAGGRHTCALASSGAVKCWGDNEKGELGNGTNTDSNVPVNVSGLGTGIRAISAGGMHTCALTSSGAVKCWGSNENGRLGNGTNTDSNVPVNVSGLSSGISAISAGNFHTCALTSSGAVKCWGNNGDGQLGNGTNTGSNVPVNVSGLGSGIKTISAGAHTCALTSSGAAKCWGENTDGELGNGTNAASNVPVNVSGLSSGIHEISASLLWHTCALTSSGAVKCWGNNGQGQLGNGTRANSETTPVTVSGFGP